MQRLLRVQEHAAPASRRFVHDLDSGWGTGDRSLRVEAQGTKADYERADALAARTNGKVFKTRVQPYWLAGNNEFWYRNALADGASEFILVDAVKATRQPAFDHARLADALGKSLGKPQRASHLPFERIVVAADGAIHFEAGGKAWRFDPKADTLKEAAMPKTENSNARAGQQAARGRRPEGSPRGEDSPDGKFHISVKDYDLVLRDRAASKDFALSYEGAESDAYEPRVFWSPDSKKLVALRTARGDHHVVNLVESSPSDQLQPKLNSYDYLKPGDRIPVSRPHLFDVATRKEIPIDGDLFPNPWSIEEIRWSPDSRRFTFLYNQRGHQVLRLVAVDAETGHAAALVDERSKTFIDYAHKHFLHFLDKTNEMIWMSERDGWNHLYLIDAQTGVVKNQITRGDWVVRQVDRVDDEHRQIWFRAGGIHRGQDPYYVHFAASTSTAPAWSCSPRATARTRSSIRPIAGS